MCKGMWVLLIPPAVVQYVYHIHFVMSLSVAEIEP
jgi:hypothetical protein